MYKTTKKKHPKTPIGVDFDGVIHWYRKGFGDGRIYDRPMPGVKQGLARLRKNYYVYVFSYRTSKPAGKRAVEAYLKKHKIPYDEITSGKPAAKFYIDDRAIRFKNWTQTLKDLAAFERELAKRKKITRAK